MDSGGGGAGLKACLPGTCRKLGRPPEPFLSPEEKVEEEDEGEEEMLSDASPWTYSSSPDEQAGAEGGAGEGGRGWKGLAWEGRKNWRLGIGWKSEVRLQGRMKAELRVSGGLGQGCLKLRDLFNLGVEWAWGWLRAQGDSALLFILLSAVSQMSPDHSLPLLPMHLRRERHPQLPQLPPALLGHPHRHPHCVLGLLHLWEVGHSRRSAGPLKQPSKLRPWPGNLMAEGMGRVWGVPWAVHCVEALFPLCCS